MAQGKRHQAEYENYQGIDMQYTFFIFYAIGGYMRGGFSNWTIFII